MKIRAEVEGFSQVMEHRLRQGDHKGGWDHETIRWLLDRLYDEVHGLWEEVGRKPADMDQIMWEASDVANFAMMIWDKARKTKGAPA